MIYNNILIPIDFSEHSYEALDTGIKTFCNDPKVKLTILHVIEGNLKESKDSEFKDSMEHNLNDLLLNAAYKKLDKIVENKKKHVENINYKIKTGIPEECIVETVNDLKIDLVIMGAHGKDSMSNIFFGPTTYNVSRRLNCSMMIIKK